MNRNDKPQHSITRRRFCRLPLFTAALSAIAPLRRALALPQYSPVLPGYTIRFPQDEGSHPGFRIEWWYITGRFDNKPRPLGFQITFFRTRLNLQHDNPSAFTPRHILIAHAAISDPAHGRLLHDQHVARAGFGLAGAGEGRVDVWIDDWSLKQEEGAYRARIPAADFQLDLVFSATQPPMLQGDNGFSRKGPQPESASYYYSLPQLAVRGVLGRGRTATPVSGRAWFDHEWSSSYMDSAATGWDWVGLNLEDGGALMAFRMRDRQNGRLWAGGTLRNRQGVTRTFSPEEVIFTPGRRWHSPRTGTVYPVTWHIRVGTLEFDILPLMDDQENDARRSTGTIYWEGAVSAMQHGKPLGRGYLELTGYWQPMNI
jgi:predicted secreted hydrolase